MIRLIFALALVSLPTAGLLADDDEWLDQKVLPRSKDTPLLDKDGQSLMKWSISGARVIAVDGDRILIQHRQYPGPYEGYVKKAEVVRLSDAVQFFNQKLQADAKDAWALSRRGEAWSLKEEHDKAVKPSQTLRKPFD